MAHKQLLFRSAAREKILRGATQLAEAVRITLGPKSKSVLIQKQWGAPIVCNDGVAIAKELSLQDPEENLGAQMLRQAAEKTGDAVGDGTSTATILAHAILLDGVRNVTAGASAIDIKRGLDRALKIVVDELKTFSKPVNTRKEKVQVATISAHNDESIGELVAEAMEKVGGEGVITSEESKTTDTALEVVEGMQFDRGYISPYFVTDNEKMEAVLEDAYVLVTDRKINILKDLVPVARTGGQGRAADPVHCGGHGGRGAGNPHRQPASRCAEERRSEGPGFRGPAQGDAAGHRGVDGRAGPLRGARRQAGGRQARSVGTSEAPGGGPRQYDHHRRSGRAPGDRGANAADTPRNRPVDERLRQGEAARAPGQTVRRGRGHPGGSAFRVGNEGQEGCSGRCDQRHQGGGCRRHRTRRGPGSAAGRPCARGASSRNAKATSGRGCKSSGAHSRRRRGRLPTIPRSTAGWW